jgi:hypothetical protein
MMIVFLAFAIMSTALIQGRSVSVVFDDRHSTSSISRSLANSLDVHQSPVSLPVNADMGFGSLTCVLKLEIEDDLSFSLRLGQNWRAYYREFMKLKGRSLTPNTVSLHALGASTKLTLGAGQNAFSERLSPFGFNMYPMFVVIRCSSCCNLLVASLQPPTTSGSDSESLQCSYEALYRPKGRAPKLAIIVRLRMLQDTLLRLRLQQAKLTSIVLEIQAAKSKARLESAVEAWQESLSEEPSSSMQFPPNFLVTPAFPENPTLAHSPSRGSICKNQCSGCLQHCLRRFPNHVYWLNSRSICVCGFRQPAPYI